MSARIVILFLQIYENKWLPSIFQLDFRSQVQFLHFQIFWQNLNSKKTWDAAALHYFFVQQFLEGDVTR